jgi:hypothetical protein
MCDGDPEQPIIVRKRKPPQLDMTARLRSALLPVLAFALAWGMATSAQAQVDVWGFVDEKGVAHFATERLDERYELYFRGGESFDTSSGVKPSAPAANDFTPSLRPLVSPEVSPKLIAFFDVSPNYKQVKHHLRQASVSHKIDYELLQALIVTESGFDAAAVSPKGAVGLMQLMPATAVRYGVKADKKTPVEQKLTDPQTNIGAGSRYLRYLLDLFPDRIDLSLAAYNAGEGAVQRAGNKIPNYPETQNYVKTVMRLYTALKPPKPIDPRLLGATNPARIRMEISANAPGRRNMVPPLVTTPSATPTKPPFTGEFKIERD